MAPPANLPDKPFALIAAPELLAPEAAPDEAVPLDPEAEAPAPAPEPEAEGPDEVEAPPPVEEFEDPTRPWPYAFVDPPSRAQNNPDMTWLMNVSSCHAIVSVERLYTMVPVRGIQGRRVMKTYSN